MTETIKIIGTPIGHHGKNTLVKLEDGGYIIEIDAILYMTKKFDNGNCEYEIPLEMWREKKTWC